MATKVQYPTMQTYEEICDECREDVVDMDTKRWKLGDRALLIETKYGEHTGADFARDIGMNKSTLAGWRRVSEFYPNSIRRKLLDELLNLTYSHYKDALRWKDLDEAIKWLEEVSREGWSPDKASHELTERIGKPTTVNGIPGMIENVFERDGKGIVEISIAPEDMEFVQGSTSVNIKAKVN